MIVRLPNDHTAGTRPGMPTPKAMVADNDLALGRLIEAVSSSPFGRTRPSSSSKTTPRTAQTTSMPTGHCAL